MSGEGNKSMGPPNLGQLLAGFLRQAAANKIGSSGDLLPDLGEVVPFQATAVYSVDPATAFRDAMVAASLFLDRDEAEAFASIKRPVEWSALVATQESMVAVPLCLGNFPQLLKDVNPLLTQAPAAQLHARPSHLSAVPGLAEWGKRMAGQARWAEALFAAGGLRLAQQFDPAKELLEQTRRAAPASWRGLLRNEEAALAWHRHDAEAASRLWEQHPQPDHPVILFNRGMAGLFFQRGAEAKGLLARAADAFSETNPWQHLARLYVTIAESA